MWDIQSNLFKITGWSEAMLAQLVDIKGKFCLHVRVRTLSVVNTRSILLLKLGKPEGNRGVGGFAMTGGVTNVVSHPPKGNGDFFCFFRVRKKKKKKPPTTQKKKKMEKK